MSTEKAEAPTPEPVFLWNWYRDRRHIADPRHETILEARTRRTSVKALCGSFQYRREMVEADLRRWNTEKSLQDRMERLDQVPICKLCAKKAGVDPQTRPKMVRVAAIHLSVLLEMAQVYADRAVVPVTQEQTLALHEVTEALGK